MRTTRIITTAFVLGAALYVAPAARGRDELLDYEKIQATIPKLRELGDKGSESNHRLHELVERLDGSNSEAEQIELRKQIRELLEGYQAVKVEMIAVTKDVLEIPPTGLTDQEVFEKLHDTELRGINWKGRSFKRCIADISRELGVRIRLQFRVVQRNTVECEFPRTQAETLLGWLCNGFDLKYVIYDGEIVIYKKITPTEERFLDYQKRHPDVKLKYWDKEKASGEYEGGK